MPHDYRLRAAIVCLRRGAWVEGADSGGRLLQAPANSVSEEVGQGGVILSVAARDRGEISFLPFLASLQCCTPYWTSESDSGRMGK